MNQVSGAKPNHKSEVERKTSTGWRAVGQQCNIIISGLHFSQRIVQNSSVLPVLTKSSKMAFNKRYRNVNLLMSS